MCFYYKLILLLALICVSPSNCNYFSNSLELVFYTFILENTFLLSIESMYVEIEIKFIGILECPSGISHEYIIRFYSSRSK